VKIAMVANFQNKQAEKYRPIVSKYAAQYKVSPSLVFAVIRTEAISIRSRSARPRPTA
jgi:membrane-bound lytic murein transglycosylase C